MKKKANDTELLSLLKKVLPKAIHDAGLASKVYEAVESELKLSSRAVAFEKFCEQCELPDLEPATLHEVKRQFEDAFGRGRVTLTPDEKEQALAVEVALNDLALSGQVKVRPVDPEQDEEQEIKLKFVPFPVALPADPELAWILAKKENMTAEEAAIALAKVEEEFWASKSGQKTLRNRVERIFPEFISRVPSKMLTEVGLKRHYKEPEPIKVLAPLQNPDAKPAMPERANKKS